MMPAPETKTWPFHPASIPEFLKQHKRWAPWRASRNAKRGQWDKIPHDPYLPARGISTTKPGAWGTWVVALEVYERSQERGAAIKFAGLGFCMTRKNGPEHNLVGIDMDNCVTDGVIAPWAQAIVDAVGSYTEFSPGRKGIRIFCLGTIPADWTNHSIGIEVYAGHAPRFLTVTGAWLIGTPQEVLPALPGVLEAIAADYAKARGDANLAPIADDLALPELLDELLLPDVAALPLPGAVEAFLLRGEVDGDRSQVLHASGICLYAAGLSDEQVLSVLAANEYALGVALDHRGQDGDRALQYLWREHCLKAKKRGQGPVASPDEFDVIEVVASSRTVDDGVSDLLGPPPAGVAVAEAAGGAAGGSTSAAVPEGHELVGGRVTRSLPNLTRNTRTGLHHGSPSNIERVLARRDLCGMFLRVDTFKDELVYSTAAGNWVDYRPFKDVDYSILQLRLARELAFDKVERADIKAMVRVVAERQAFDTAIAWLEGLRWDGVPRVERFFIDYFGAADTPYVRAVGRYAWTALAGRALVPGEKADIVPVLVGDQGTIKSSALAAMVNDDYFVEVSFTERPDDLARKMRGKLVVEISELDGLRTRELEGIKAWVTKCWETWVPKYMEFSTRYGRRAIPFGTTNDPEFLADHTGNRRWAPIVISRADKAAISRDRDQLWAEAACMYTVLGVDYHLAEQLAVEVHEAHTITEPWAEFVEDWLNTEDNVAGTTPRTCEFLRTDEIAREGLQLDSARFTKAAEMRIGKAMRELGYDRVQRKVGGRNVRVWTAKGSE